MYLDSLDKEKLYFSVANILLTDVEKIKRYVEENAEKIVGNHYDEYSIENMDLDELYQICDCQGLLGSPEFLKSLSNAYADHRIADQYAEKCKNYMVSFRVPIEQIDIEGFSDSISTRRKTDLLLKYSINRLAYLEVKGKPFFYMYNPIIFLKRGYDVPGLDIKKIWTFKFGRNKITPVEI